MSGLHSERQCPHSKAAAIANILGPSPGSVVGTRLWATQGSQSNNNGSCSLTAKCMQALHLHYFI